MRSSQARDLVNTFARSALRRAFRGRVVPRRLPASVGSAKLYVSPESQLKYLRPGRSGFDGDLLTWAERHVSKGDVVWDIGANSGIFTFAAAGCGAAVLAVEPDPFLVNALMRSVNANPSLRVEVASLAVSDVRGQAVLQIASDGRAANALAQFASGRPHVGRSSVSLIVPTIPLDDLLAHSTPDLIKIDVEGAELAVFRGAGGLLAGIRPKIIFEVGRERWPEISSLLRQVDYRLVDPLNTEREADETTWNVLALPS